MLTTLSRRSASASRRASSLSFRAGYPDYLRTATVGELAAVALPGAAGIFVLAALGGLVGFRQARAALALPPANMANVVRFLQ